ncbi:glutathione peroxidase [Adhaeribacter rhizoryzae]|nr:glutathione peroxidase [Adhaeribacter rhizoryzae]
MKYWWQIMLGKSWYKQFWVLVVCMELAACGQQTSETKNITTMEDNTTIQASENAQHPSVYDFEFKTLQGELIALNEFKGRKMLLVNVASECGYTPQYKELQALYEKYGDRVVVLGFPANDFGGQEPGSNEEIATFCERNYGVQFPVFQKISVTGSEMHPLYKYLSNKSLNGVTDEAPNWNFCKYLIDENGNVVKFFPSKVAPLSPEIVDAIVN